MSSTLLISRIAYIIKYQVEKYGRNRDNMMKKLLGNVAVVHEERADVQYPLVNLWQLTVFDCKNFTSNGISTASISKSWR
jgi:hypothetical protein